MISPGYLALVTGLAASSYFTFANIGAAYFGVMPATARGVTVLPVRERLALWEFSVEVGKLHMASSISISAIALSAAAYFLPSTRALLLAGAAAAYSTVAFTVMFVLPLNAGLSAMLRSASVKPMDDIEEQHALDQLDRWRARHSVRIVLGTIVWSAATIAILSMDSMF
ncbi:hypothetical protein C8R44DRAFT_848645 [Mycena epipterygia]|nr:hypothetical protein C8R44DRAFT_848645 [Mycena epipterygia]